MMAASFIRGFPSLAYLMPRCSATMKTTITANLSIWSQKSAASLSSNRIIDRIQTTTTHEQFRLQSDSTKSKALFAMDDIKENTSLMLANLKHLKAAPKPALTLGLAGLIPFVAAPTFMLIKWTYMPYLALAQWTYGACILSFLGGVRWGYTIPEGSNLKLNWKSLGYSVTPPLVAWLGLLMSPGFGSLAVCTGLLGAAYFDVLSSYPPWFKGLRVLLTAIAAICIFVTLIFRLLLKEKSQKSAATSVSLAPASTVTVAVKPPDEGTKSEE